MQLRNITVSFALVAVTGVSAGNYSLLGGDGKQWTWTSETTSTSGDTVQTSEGNFDLGVSFDFPMGWDSVNTWSFDTSVSAWIGGEQSYDFTTENFALTMTLWTYPLWWDMVYTELSYDHGKKETCVGVYSDATVLEFFLDITVGVNSCYTGFYDYFLADTTSSHTCDFVYYGFSDIVNYNYDNLSYSMWPNNCNSAEALWYKILEPSGPSVTERVYNDSESVKTPDETN